jgi:hypothetical protein
LNGLFLKKLKGEGFANTSGPNNHARLSRFDDLEQALQEIFPKVVRKLQLVNVD